MSGGISARVGGLLALSGAAVIAGLASGRPELVVLAVPFMLFIGISLALVREPQLTATVELDRARLLEGDEARASVTLQNAGNSPVEIEFALVRSRHLGLEHDGAAVLHLAGGERTEIRFAASPQRWGAHAIGPLLVRVRDPVGVATWSQRLGNRVTLRAFPREQRLREVVAPLRTQPFLGSHVSRARGDGIEFADIRAFAPGDRVRQVNWRATARRSALFVTERHPEHSTDVVLLLDTFAEARDAATGTLDDAVRAAASLARAHLAHRDRVALVDFGGTLRWLEPAFGSTQLYRIIDALLASEIAFSYAWRAVAGIPRRVLPPGALILAISPLLDERSIRLISELRTRGCDVSVVEVSPLAHTSSGSTAADAAAYQLWGLQREAVRAHLQGLGIGVALWNADGALAPALEGVNSFRRSVRHAVSA